MAQTSSASPRELDRYAQLTRDIDQALIRRSGDLRGVLSRFESRCRESGMRVSVSGEPNKLRSLGTSAIPVDNDVARVARLFRNADRRNGVRSMLDRLAEEGFALVSRTWRRLGDRVDWLQSRLWDYAAGLHRVERDIVSAVRVLHDRMQDAEDRLRRWAGGLGERASRLKPELYGAVGSMLTQVFPILGEYSEPKSSFKGPYTMDMAPVTSMTEEQWAAWSTLAEMKGSDEPVTDDQIDILAAAFGLDPDSDEIRERWGDMTQAELYILVNGCGLSWNPDESASDPAVLDVYPRAGDPENSINQQLIVLGMQYGDDPDAFADGVGYIKAVQAGTVISTYPQLDAEEPSALGVLIAGGTTTPGEWAPSHSRIGIGPGLGVDAGLGSDRRTRFGRSVDRYIEMREVGSGVQVHVVPGITEEQRREAAVFAAEQIDEPYNVIGLLFGAIGEHSPEIPEQIRLEIRLGGEIKTIEIDTPEAIQGLFGGMYCSELVYKALRDAGVNIVPSEEEGRVEGFVYTSVGGPAGQVAIDSRVSPNKLKNSTVDGQGLIPVYVWFPDGYPISGEAIGAPAFKEQNV